MASNNAKAVAKEVIETLGKSRKVQLGKIIRKHGYSDRTSKTPQNVTNTKSYQEEINPFVDAMVKQRQRAIDAIASRKLSKDKTRDLVDMIDKLTKNVQLLSGKATGRLTISDVLAKLEEDN